MPKNALKPCCKGSLIIGSGVLLNRFKVKPDYPLKLLMKMKNSLKFSKET
jgi:hypothetical protein